MPASLSAFTGLLSDLQDYFKKQISVATLYPLLLVAIALGLMAANIVGFDRVEQSWSTLSGLDQALLGLLSVVFFLAAAYVLAGLQGSVARLFQGDWPIWLERTLAGKPGERHRSEWARRNNRVDEIKAAYQTIDRVRANLNSAMPDSETMHAARALSRYAVLAADDLAATSESAATLGFVGAVTRRALASGDAIGPDDVVMPLDRTWTHGMEFVEVACDANHAVEGLAAGHLVHVYSSSPHGVPINPGGSLVIDVSRPSAGPGAPANTLLGITLAVPPEWVGRLSAARTHADLSISVRPAPPHAPLWDTRPLTRRWLPSFGTVPADPLMPGDIRDITYQFPDQPAITLHRATFLEATDGGWVFGLADAEAVRLARGGDAARIVSPAAGDVTVELGFSSFTYPAFAALQAQDAYPLQATVNGSATVRQGSLFAVNTAFSDAVLDHSELTGRFAAVALPEQQPIPRSGLAPGPQQRLFHPAPDALRNRLTALRQQLQQLRQGANGRDPCVHLVYPAATGDPSDWRRVVLNCSVRELPNNQFRVVVPVAAGDLVASTAPTDVIPAPSAVHSDSEFWPAAVERVFSYPPQGRAGAPQLADCQGSMAGVVLRWRDPQPPRAYVDQRYRALVRRVPLAGETTWTLLLPESPPHPALLEWLLPVKYLDPIIAYFESLPDSGPGSAARWLEELRDPTTHTLHTDVFPPLGWAILALQDLAPLATPAQKERISQLENRIAPILRDADSEALYRFDQQTKQFQSFYPQEAVAVAPTSIGNVLRAVDSYCNQVYGIDTALLLPRLQVVLDIPTLQQLQNAQDQVQLLEWTWLGVMTVGVVGTVMNLLAAQLVLAFLLALIAFPLAALVVYPAAVGATVRYAESLRLAFDSERGKVLDMLGIDPPSEIDQDAERQLWGHIATWLQYGSYPAKYQIQRSGSNSPTKASSGG